MNSFCPFKKLIFITFCLFLVAHDSFGLKAQEVKTEEERDPYASKNNLKDDTIDTVKLFLNGSIKQFQSTANLGHLAVFGGATWYAFENDDKMLASVQKKNGHGYHRLASDSAIFMNFPIAALGAYAIGRKNNDEKLVRFAKEFVAANFLANIETGILSHFYIHDRPNKEEQTFFETAFREESSFPSGHITPYVVLVWKTAQFYGPWWALPPLALATLTGFERVNTGRHYPSDIAGGILLAVCASEGVRVASGYKNNHPFYRWIYQHDVAFTPILGRKITGLNLSAQF